MSLPESKIKRKINGMRDDCLLVTNLRSNDLYKSQALSDYELKKDSEKKAIHKEIKRISLDSINV